MRIGVDLLGSDRPYKNLFLEVCEQLNDLPSFLNLVFFLPEGHNLSSIPQNIDIIEVPQVILMTDLPLEAIKKKPLASLPQAVKMLKSKDLDALITVGNTGALTACTSLFGTKFKNIRRPALIATLPKETYPLSFLDVGATLDFTPDRLFKVAQIGSLYHALRYDIEMPKLGLLNIGAEAQKGTKGMQDLYEHLENLENAPYRFLGNVEARDLFSTEADVVLTDGFTGNIVLKVSEGLAAKFFSLLTKDHGKNLSDFCYKAAPGALMLGLKEVIIKCHGEGSAQTFIAAIKEAQMLVEKNILTQLYQRQIHY